MAMGILNEGGSEVKKLRRPRRAQRSSRDWLWPLADSANRLPGGAQRLVARPVVVVKGCRHAGPLGLLPEGWTASAHEHLDDSIGAYDESKIGACHAAPGLGARAGSGVRWRGPSPQREQRVMSVPVNCHIHSATVFLPWAGGSGVCPRSCRHWRSARALHRLARKPRCRIR